MRAKKNVALALFIFCLCNIVSSCVAMDMGDIETAMQEAQNEMTEAENQDMAAFEAGIDNQSHDSVQFEFLIMHLPRRTARLMSVIANLQLKTLKCLLKKGLITLKDIKINKKFRAAWRKMFKKHCERYHQGITCDKKAKYRTADGTCNNLKNPTWGSAMRPHLRMLPPVYDDGVDSARQTSVTGGKLASTRKISNIIFNTPNKQPRNKKLTMLVMFWGQFIDHDITLTPVFKGEMGSSINCCGNDMIKRQECLHIDIPKDDPYFSTCCMNFVRSLPAPDQHCYPANREQLNQVTSFIDGSAVYGNSKDQTSDLRTGYDGLLKTETYNLLPRGPPDSCKLKFPATEYCWKAGDPRVSVVPSLSLSHLIFVREHNRIAKKLKSLNQRWNDEKLFQEARKILSAILQHIHYNKYLSSYLNEETMRKYNLWSKKKGYANVYKKRVNPTLTNVMASAAYRFDSSQRLSITPEYLRFALGPVIGRLPTADQPGTNKNMVESFQADYQYPRASVVGLPGIDMQPKLFLKTPMGWGKKKTMRVAFADAKATLSFAAKIPKLIKHGHSQAADYQATMDKYYKNFTSIRPIEMTYMNPHMLQTNSGEAIEGMIRWLVDDPVPLADQKFGDGVRLKLFESSPGVSLDLPALNMQRGRDHGLPSYNEWRKFCKLGRAKNFKNLKDIPEQGRKQLKKAYKHVDDIDLYAGAMLENHLPDSFLGPTFTCIQAKEFQDLKQGDRFWYETPKKRIKFTRDQLAEIKKVSMAMIFCRNADIDTIQPNVFKVEDASGNKRVPCSDIPDVNLNKWKE